MAALKLITVVTEFEAASFLHLGCGQALDLVALHHDHHWCWRRSLRCR